MTPAVLVTAALAMEVLAAPSLVDPSQVLLPPGAALRAETASHVSALPLAPRTYELVCAVLPNSGRPTDCLAASTNPTPSYWPEFRQASLVYASSLRAPGADMAALAAMERVLLTRLKTEDPVGGPDHKLYIFRETISAEDVARTPPPAVATLARSEVSFDANPDPDTMISLYPERAVRRNWSANVKVVCRVMPSRNLVCRDGEITFPGSADTNAPAPDNGREFILATYQITSMMQVAPKTLAGRETVGSDVIMTLAWRLPD